MDENQIRAIVKEELLNFNPPKKKRAPNKWQNFLKDCSKRQPEELVYTDKVKLCSIEYKEAKKNGGVDKLLSQNANSQGRQDQNVQDHVNNQDSIINDRKNIRQSQEETDIL